MKKRHFLRNAGATLALSATSVAMSSLPELAARPRGALAGPALLTVTGEIDRPNRGPIDHALDQMMHKQKLDFDRAHVFDFTALTALPAVEIRPTLEYDQQPHTLRGPLLTEVMRAAGAAPDAQGYVLRAIDGYAVMVSREQALAYRFIIATHLDGKPMALGGLGPLWAVYDADRIPELATRPVAERFGLCPWGIYHIAVRKA